MSLSVYTLKLASDEEGIVHADRLPGLDECTCLAVRQAARHITQFYDQHLASFGLRTTQFSILARLSRMGPVTVNALADVLIMDRTTLGRNILPLVRDGLLSTASGKNDRRSKELRVTEAGLERLMAARKGWSEAQDRFAAVFGKERTIGLRALLLEVSTAELPQASAEPEGSEDE